MVALKAKLRPKQSEASGEDPGQQKDQKKDHLWNPYKDKLFMAFAGDAPIYGYDKHGRPLHIETNDFNDAKQTKTVAMKNEDKKHDHKHSKSGRLRRRRRGKYSAGQQKAVKRQIKDLEDIYHNY